MVLVLFLCVLAFRFLSSDPSIPCLVAFGCPAGWLFLCRWLGFCVDCWGLSFGSLVSPFSCCSVTCILLISVDFWAGWAAVPKACELLLLRLGFLPLSSLRKRPPHMQELVFSNSLPTSIWYQSLDPANDHGFVYNTKGQVDILQSPFFDFSPDVDHSVEEYVDRIIFQLAATSMCNFLPFNGALLGIHFEVFMATFAEWSLVLFLCVLAFRFLSSDPSVPCLVAFGCPAGWLFLCRWLGFRVDCWGLSFGSLVSPFSCCSVTCILLISVDFWAGWAAVP
ncbi:hypothetical protein M5K25_009615 [Dendrobium thyrsiflorum]|uniref:Uncharacterized protein n=1 Tax=Dendrobium thyrsiflorum TaxID=117978 RepID=A0ABD0V6Y2_DENTH